MARTAVAAGTWTAVSNRVSRRQANRWAGQEQQQQQQYAYAQQQAAYAQQQPVYVQQAAPAPAAPAPDPIAQLKQLGELKAQGILTEEEFTAQKAKILAA
jgi:hypothetical protein